MSDARYSLSARYGSGAWYGPARATGASARYGRLGSPMPSAPRYRAWRRQGYAGIGRHPAGVRPGLRQRSAVTGLREDCSGRPTTRRAPPPNRRPRLVVTDGACTRAGATPPAPALSLLGANLRHHNQQGEVDRATSRTRRTCRGRSERAAPDRDGHGGGAVMAADSLRR